MPSASVLEQKQKFVSDLSERIKNSSGGVLVDYNGINVEDDTRLRKELREAGVQYEVIKNTLFSKACDQIGYEGLKSVLTGMTALAVSGADPVTPAKILSKYAKTNETFKIKAGFAEGKLLDAAGVEELALIPSKEILIARMMGSLQSSLYSFAYAIQAIIDKNNGGEPESADSAAVS